MIVENILNKNYVEAKKHIIERMQSIIDQKIIVLKKIVAENLMEKEPEDEVLDEANVMRQGRVKLIKIRIRAGKVQRRVKKSAIKGFSFRGGKLKRISISQRMHMKRGQKRGALKRRAKMARSIMKRKRSIRKLKSLGVK